MTVAPPLYFTREHYETQRGLASGKLCELVVHCLELVACLAELGLPFRFKGGNSLLLILERPERFSIDVDIATSASRAELVAAVEQVVARSGQFTGWQARQPRTKPWLPLASFKLFFSSCYPATEPAHVMLDAVLEPSPYPGERRLVRCASLYHSEQWVELPTVSGLMGDKLLTVGPSTLGIPVGRGKQAQRLKHVFDLALLSRTDYDLDLVRQSLLACRAQEQRLQNKRVSWPEIRDDTAEFCRQPLDWPEPPPLGELPAESYLAEMVAGFEEFRAHLWRKDYGWQMLQEDCRRVIELLEKLDATGLEQAE